MSLRASAAVLAALCISACAHMPEIGAGHGADAASATSPRTQVRAAIDLLDAGDARGARAALRAVLRNDPDNATALMLMEQMDGDPRTLLGPDARPYTVRPGETLSQIAERNLGNGLLFYALARYNRIEAPNSVSAGQVLMVPRRVNASSEAQAAPSEAPVATSGGMSARSTNVAHANQLRLQGLQQLNGGNVDSAVRLLRQAQALDTANPAIQRDLDRALRLQASLRTSRG